MSSVVIHADSSEIFCYCMQGLDEPFLEQWHQKLHQNTTQEDVSLKDFLNVLFRNSLLTCRKLLLLLTGP
jgi:hypothetical protein